MDAATDPEELLREYARRHDAGVASGDFAPLAALFADDGEIAFHGADVAPARGPAAVERLFRDRGPGDALVLGDVHSEGRGRAYALHGWRSSPGLFAGSVHLTARGGRIERLTVVVFADGPRPPLDREAVRVLLLAPGPRLLLVLCRDLVRGASWWFTPGGGIDPGEDLETAARRELAEEVGFDATSLGPCVWTRVHLFPWNGRAVRQRERFVVAEAPAAFVPRPALDAAALAAEGLAAHRWWTVPELLAERDARFAPRRLPELVAGLLRDGPPPAPVDVGT